MEKVLPYSISAVQSKGITIRINNRDFSLAKYLLDIQDKNTRVLRIDNTVNDYRRSNLYYQNKVDDMGEYARVFDYAGKSFMIDKKNLHKVLQYRWHVDCQDYVLAKVDGRTIKLHRLLLGVLDNDNIEVDHINRDRTDNRMCNLRLATRSINMHNTGINKNNTSGYKGVYPHANGKSWCAQINVRGKRKYLGYYQTMQEAIQARQRAEQELLV